MSRPEARDLAITAVICFVGGVGLTLLVVLIYYQVSRKKKLKESKRQEEEEEGSTSVISNHVNHVDVSEKRRDVFMQNSSNQTLDRKAMMLENHGGHFRSRVDEDGSHVRCLDCTNGQRGVWPNHMRWNNGTNREMKAEEDREKTRMRMMMTEEERRNPGTQQGILSRDIPDKLLSLDNSNSFSHPWREAFSERPETLTAYKTDRNMDIHRTDVEGRSNETLHCESCHRTYRPPEHSMRPGRIHSNMRDSLLFDGFPPQHRPIDVGRNYNQFDMMKNTDFRRESRHVTFDLEQGEDRRERGRSSRDKEKGRKRRQKVKNQSPRKLKVKVNLSPLRKSKVHPTRKNEQGHLDKSSSKKSKEKRQDGKEKEGEEGRSKSGRKTKGSSEKIKKSTKSTGLSEEEKETKEDGEGKSKTTSQQKKTEDTAADKKENTNPDNPQPTDTTSTAEQSASASTIGQGQNLQGGSIQYQEAGLLLRNAPISSQHPFSLSAADRNRTANLSLLGSADSHLTGSSLSLQGGNILLNTMAPGSNALFPSGQANSVAPIIGPSSASSAGNSFNRQTGAGLMSPATSLLANYVHANTLPASVLQNIPLHNSQAGGLSTNITNPSVNPVPRQAPSQSRLPPDSSPLVARLQNDPAQGPGPQTVEGPHQLPLETQAAQTKESLPVQAQAPPSTDGFSGVTPQAPGSETHVERLSDNTGRTGTEHVPGGTTVKMLAGGVSLPGGAAVGVSGDSMEPANVSVSGVCVPGISTQSGSFTGAEGAAALLQQEYVSEEGGSSPRRKLRLVLPEKTSSRPPTALERKIR
nr:PREDICTED: nuclear receptor corepressor 2-like [Paralichthys olivaceus]XP_019961874.1 PREDICTED: nuclear receptor corepressor 2-like [Paralichthys olivaceus]